eukprot:355678-Chlamydomonas_euryale.AAC.1
MRSISLALYLCDGAVWAGRLTKREHRGIGQRWAGRLAREQCGRSGAGRQAGKRAEASTSTACTGSEQGSLHNKS